MPKLYLPLVERNFERELERLDLNDKDLQAVIYLLNRAFDAGCVETFKSK